MSIIVITNSGQVPTDVLIAEIAARQHGVFSREQALGAGASKGFIVSRLRAGRWERPFRGVYVINGSRPTWRRNLMAACLAWGSDAAVSHIAAASLRRFPDIESRRVELIVPRERERCCPGTIPHFIGPLPDDEIEHVDGIPVTSSARTLLDLATILRPDDLEDLLDYTLLRRLVQFDELAAKVSTTWVRRPGVELLRRLLHARRHENALPDSRLERLFMRIVREFRLPRPVMQFEIRIDGHLVAVPDFAYPDHKLAIEADGFENHGGRRKKWQRDLGRGNDLTVLEWRTLRFTKQDLRHRRRAVADAVKRALGST